MTFFLEKKIFYDVFFKENFFDSVFLEKKIFLYSSNMGRRIYTDTENWVAEKIS